MDSNFLASVFATPPVLLGRQLRPYCCGHAVILAALDSPFSAGGTITAEEIIAAVWVCSRSYEEARAKLTGDADAMVEECRKWGESIGPWNFTETVAAFQAYLAEHTKAPSRWRKAGQKEAKAPWPLTVATSLMRELKMSEARAWNMPLQEALWYFASIAETAYGDDSLVSEGDRERMRIAREGRAA